MKSLCGIYVLFLVALTVAAAADTSNSESESEEFDKYILEQATLCQKEYNATDNEMKELLNGAEPLTKISKCLNGCLMNKLGVMDGSNKLVPDKLDKIVADDSIKTKDGKTLKSMVKDLADVCKGISDKDICEAAGKILTCLNTEAKKRGFDTSVF